MSLSPQPSTLNPPAAPGRRTFRAFMEQSLYGEGGFYQRRKPGEDFYTAPELHPAFGRLLGRELGVRLGKLEAAGVPGPYTVVEAGCGDGTLFRAVLEGLAGLRSPAGLRFALVDRSESALRAARESAQAGLKLSFHRSISELKPFSGALYSNELMDAMPFHVLEKAGGAMWELTVDDGPGRAPVPPGPLAQAAESVRDALPEGGRHAVCLEAGEWLKAAARKLKAGVVVTVDYGARFAPDAPIAPRSFRKHATGPELLGGADLTAHVDFERLVREGEAAGLALEWYGTQARFLLDRGVLDLLEGAGPAERNKLKTLFHPDGMGEVFKVLIQSKALPAPRGRRRSKEPSRTEKPCSLN